MEDEENGSGQLVALIGAAMVVGSVTVLSLPVIANERQRRRRAPMTAGLSKAPTDHLRSAAVKAQTLRSQLDRLNAEIARARRDPESCQLSLDELSLAREQRGAIESDLEAARPKTLSRRDRRELNVLFDQIDDSMSRFERTCLRGRMK